MRSNLRRIIGSLAACGLATSAGIRLWASEIVLPEDRTAYYADEPIEIAVCGLAKGATANVEITPRDGGAQPVSFTVSGDGGAAIVRVPAGTLAPGKYALKLDSKEVPGLNLTVASGVWNSTMLVSQAGPVEPAGGNFIVGNMAGTGLLDGGQPAVALRHGPVVNHTYASFNNAIERNLPTILYMYWTGYVLHKPWGSKKSWANAAESEAMRLFNFRAAEVARRYARNIATVGTIDEPGLNWGKNAFGAWGSGFANWDSEPWYAQRGWKFTLDPGSREDADWMKYMSIRTGVIGEHFAQARKDLETLWPEVPFSTDNYAVSIVCDGADAMNQAANKIPCTHVFLDWGVPRAAAGTEIYIEKSHDPTAPLAHAMNGRLFGEPIPSAQCVTMYHLMMNAMLEAGLFSNWWLNLADMRNEDFVAVNEVAQRIGPLFREMRPTRHDVAVLWSFTELCMREKPVVAQQGQARDGGKPIKLMISALPENTAMSGTEIDLNTYSVGGNYRNEISHAHAALLRAGYPAHVVHERVLARLLKNYKVLVVVGQQHPLPQDVMAAIEKWQADGGQVVVDKTTTVPFQKAILTEADFKDIGYRWGALFGEADKTSPKPGGGYENRSKFKTVREASKYQSNWFMGSFTRAAVAPMKEALRKTKASAILETDQVNLIAERHLGGDGMLYMVLNANDVLPDNVKDDQKYLLYNYAPLHATFTLKGIPAGHKLYCIEGIDWKKVTEVTDYRNPITTDFAAGEMKLYLAVPSAPKKLTVSARAVRGTIEVDARLHNLKSPWPITVTLANAEGKELYKVYRSTNTGGRYTEAFPIGANAKAGRYAVTVDSPVSNLHAQETVDYKATVPPPATVTETVRVFDGKAITEFLATKPRIVIAVAGDTFKAQAEKLAGDLRARGIKASVADEKTALKKVLYPRLWNPYTQVVKAEGETKQPSGEVKTRITIETEAQSAPVAKGEDGKPVTDWMQPLTLATVGPKGLLLWENLDDETVYEAGTVLYVNKDRVLEVVKGSKPVEVNATEEFKARWLRPWSTLTVYNGGFQLPPELPEAYEAGDHLILLGDSSRSEAVRTLQASEVLAQVVDGKYPGPGKALLQMAWSPFALEKNVIHIGASDEQGVEAGARALIELASGSRR